MSRISRRMFVIESAVLATAARSAFGRAALTKSNLGVQLYTVRNVIGANPAAVLKGIEAIGYTEVEATYDKLDQIWPALQQTTLKAVSVHIDAKIFKGDAAQLDHTLSDLKQCGFEYVVLPFYETANQGAEGVVRAADVMNKAAEHAKTAGLTFCYHNHAHDFQPIDGTPALDLLMRETDRDLVHLELDIFWASVAGHDPIDVLRMYSGRVPLLHLKDKAQGVPVQFNEHVPAGAFKEVGNGTIDIPAVLSAADAAGVQNYFVEQDQSADPMVSMRKSYNNLKAMFKS